MKSPLSKFHCWSSLTWQVSGTIDNMALSLNILFWIIAKNRLIFSCVHDFGIQIPMLRPSKFLKGFTFIIFRWNVLLKTLTYDAVGTIRGSGLVLLKSLKISRTDFKPFRMNSWFGMRSSSFDMRARLQKNVYLFIRFTSLKWLMN